MDAVHGVANVYHRYLLPDQVTLVSDVNDRDRFVRITPVAGESIVGHGWRTVLAGGADEWSLAAPVEPFAELELNAAIQRFCVLVATWLDGNEREIEQIRQSFLSRA